MDPNNPRDTWRRIQNAVQSAQQSGRKGAGAPKGAIGGGVALILLTGVVLAGNSALFNGMKLDRPNPPLV